MARIAPLVDFATKQKLGAILRDFARRELRTPEQRHIRFEAARPEFLNRLVDLSRIETLHRARLRKMSIYEAGERGSSLQCAGDEP